MNDDGVNYIERFCLQVETRSREINLAMPLMIEQRAWAVAGSLLRLQVESLVRAAYLLDDPLDVRRWRVAVALQALGEKNGKFPISPDSRGTISDSDMAKRADQIIPGLRNSALNIYKLGCGLVHLTTYYEYQQRDPFRALPESERHDHVIDPLKAIWSTLNVSVESSFQEVMTVVGVKTLEKLTSLLSEVTARLRQDSSISANGGINYNPNG